LRRGIWRHPRRNRHIAGLAKTLAADRSDGLRERFPELYATANKTWPLRVAILVAGLEQAVAVARLLPGWSLIGSASVNDTGLPTVDKELLRRLCSQIGRRDHVIVTIAASENFFDPREFDVLIRADGGTDLPPIRKKHLILENGVDHRLVLVDFRDGHHPELRRRSRRRRDAYAAAGWFAPGVDPIEQRVRQFIASRPKAV
jgi:hypothetical protein